MKFYGNWCGPGWSAHQMKNAADLTEEDKKVPAIDELDQCCKEHDIELSEAKTDDDVQKANYKFRMTASQISTYGQAMALAVFYGGPQTVADVQAGKTYRSGKSFYNLLCHANKDYEKKMSMLLLIPLDI